MFYEKIHLNTIYKLNTDPILEIYIPDFDDSNIQSMKKGILITPGGGYNSVSKREGDPVACAFMERGYNTFVLTYTVNPNDSEDYYPKPYIELMAAIHYIRTNNDRLRTFKDKITLLGFSAGGHLSASYPLIEKDIELRNILGFKDEDLKPNSLILGYPVLDFITYHHSQTKFKMTHNDSSLINKLTVPQNVRKDYPPTFIWTTDNDDLVPSMNTYLMIEALKKNNIKYAAKIYPYGRHGLSIGNKALNPNVDIQKENVLGWIDLADEFIRNL